MNSNEGLLKKIAPVAVIFMAVLMVLGAVYYKERSLFSDAAFRLFHIINESSFNLPGNRYGAFVIQLLPYLAVKLHASVSTILFCYGVSYNLFYFIVVLFLVYRFREYALALILCLFYFLFVTESYIWVSETYIGTAWLFLMLSVSISMRKRGVKLFWVFLVFSVLCFLTIFSHFILIIPTFYLIIYYMVDKKMWPFSRLVSVLMLCIVAAIIAWKFIDTASQAYDVKLINQTTHFTFADILNTFKTPVVSIFLYRCLTLYWPAIIVLVLGIFGLVRQRKFVLAIWTVLSIVGYILIIGITYREWNAEFLLFHIESEWVAMGIIVATPFVFAFLPGLNVKISASLVAVILIVRLVYIVIAIEPFSHRLQVNEEVLAQMRKKNILKLALTDTQDLVKINKLFWALPFESIMMSKMKDDKPQRTFFLLNTDEKVTVESIKIPGSFYFYFGVTSSRDVHGYFSVDSTAPYKVMSYKELMQPN